MPSVNRRLVLKSILIARLRKRLKRKQREVSIRDIFLDRFQQGESILARDLRNDPHYHHRYFRMSKESFDEILELIGKEITGKITHTRPITAIEKLAVTLRYLATGNSQVSLALSYRISPSSISAILRDVLKAIRNNLGPTYLPKPNEQTWKENEVGFRNIWNYPNACGAMDGKHIKIQAPSFSGSKYYNYKNYYSVVLLAIADPQYKFTVVDIGASGSQSDGGVFLRSSLGKSFQDGSLKLPNPKLVGNKILPHVLLADDAFSLKQNLMKPFPGKFLEPNRRIFNYRLSRARMVIENAFGILSARWRIFHTIIVADMDLTKLIIEASVVLHNFLIHKKDMNSFTMEPETQRNSNETCGTSILSDIAQQGSNNFSATASEVRNNFMEYFNSDQGSVSWQENRI